MAPISKKKSEVLSPSELLKKSPVPKKRRKIKHNNSNQNYEGKSKGTSLSRMLETKSQGLLNSKNSAKKRTNSELKLKKRNVRQSKEKETAYAGDIPVDEMDVQQLLALGEQSHVDLNSRHPDGSQFSTDSDSDFEEVKNIGVNEPIIPKDGVSISLEVPNVNNKNKKKGFDLAAHLKRQMNRVRKDLQLLIHKVHVLCWIAHLRFVNNTLNNPILLESCASFVKSKNLYPSKYADLNYLEGILKWFHKNFDLKKDFVDPLCTGGLLEEMNYQIKLQQAFTSKAFIFMFVILLRVLGLKARVVMSFQVLPVKPSLLELYGDEIKARSEKLKKFKAEKVEKDKNIYQGIKEEVQSSCSKSVKRKSSDNLVGKKKKKGKMKVEVQKPTEICSDESESEHFKPSPNFKNLREKNSFESKAAEVASKVNVRDRKSTNDIKKSKSNTCNEEEDKNFISKMLTVKKKESKIHRKEIVIEKSIKKKEGCDVWVEVYLEAEEKWLSVDIPRQKIHCIDEIYSRATHPVVYIIACNNDGTLKDVTKRYVPRWHSDTRKRQVDEDWWNETMKNFLPAKTSQDKEEDEDINRQVLDKPMPSSISEFKDHPVYALKRHLLKFEAIYPPDAPTLGFVRGEPVYARECVFTLHSREMWYKQARLVRLKEEPYKIVKARPKYDKMTNEIKKDLPLELFGKWQTEDYIPPVATGGKVPRNEYGNVDLFKPCMLPIGTVHLQIPAVNRIAKKLDIDCAPATVGFDFHSGGSHPVFDGFVVCEEFKDVLLDAWNKEIDESSKKEEEKKEKRVFGNWKRLIRGLLIREKLKIKYAFGENPDEECHSKSFVKASTS